MPTAKKPSSTALVKARSTDVATVPSFSDLLEAEVSKAGPGSKCVVGKILKGSEEPIVVQLQAAMARDTDDVPSSAIARALHKFGIEVDPQSIRRHRRGECKCPPT